jgi:serine/threonine protein kinase
MSVRIEKLAEPIPGYRLLERLGGGGFGEVWKCEAPGGLHKAIKFVYGDLGAAGDDGHRAEQELKALSRVKTVRHPYILSLERYDIIDGQLLIVMELADRNLWDRFKECRAEGMPGIPREELLGYMAETAEALDLMNSLYQLQHLDIKPQNLFLVHNHVKVADFGLVKDLQGMQASVTGGVTPVYAAPETFDGWVSRFSDQYSLAIVYQELLTGQRPFSGMNVRQLILQHIQSPPNITPLPERDRPIVGRALSKTPEDRYPCCTDVVHALREATGSVPAPRRRVEAEESTSPPRTTLPSPPPTPDPGPLTSPQLTSNIRLPLPPEPPPATTTSLRIIKQSGPRPEEAHARRKAVQEVHGDGTLFPALVLGLGQMGLQVLQGLREVIHTRFGGPDQVPHVRLLLLDTDPEIIRQATRCDRPAASLSTSEVLLAPLNRPSYYLKQREGRPPLDKWLPMRMIYRIPRSQVTTGVRALGRLAYCDNFRSICRRLESELDALLAPEPLAEAVRRNGLGMRTNRPRVYVLCGLGGGSGSGAFLDVAYTVRSLLRQRGFEQPDVVGILLLPPVDGSRTSARAIGNAHAALLELRYFAQPENCFTAVYDDREAPLQDPGPPFSRSVLLPTPDETDEAGTERLIQLSGEYLYRELFAPLGKAADLARADAPSPPWGSRGLYYQTFNLFQLSWPRHLLFDIVSRRLCSRLLQRWMSKDSKPVREQVQAWVQSEWARHNLAADEFINQLTQLCVEKVDEEPELLCRQVLQPLYDKYMAPPATPPPGRGRGPKTTTPVEMSAEEVGEVLTQFELLLGKPPDDGALEQRARVVTALREASDQLAVFWGQKLAEMPVRLIEEPDHRLAGAEEAVRQVVATIEQVLQHHEPLLQDLSNRSREAFDRLKNIAWPQPQQPKEKANVWVEKVSEVISRRSAGPTATDLLELMRQYAKWRYQSLVLSQVATAFVTLRGHLADEMREINFCRIRLTELLRMVDEAGTSTSLTTKPHCGQHIFPVVGMDLRSAVDEFLGKVRPEDLRELDGRIEAMLKEKFGALVYVCLAAGSLLTEVHRAMLEVTRAFVLERIGILNVAELFLQQCPDEEEALSALSGYFERAAPAPLWAPTNGSGVRSIKGRGAQLCVLATPPGEEGDRLHELARAVLPDVPMQGLAGDAPESVVLYREITNLPLADLELLGPAGQEQYLQMNSAAHFTAHARMDIEFVTPDHQE